MAKVIQCPCGFFIREEGDKALIHAAQLHAKNAHGIELTEAQAIAMAKPDSAERKLPHDKGNQV